MRTAPGVSEDLSADEQALLDADRASDQAYAPDVAEAPAPEVDADAAREDEPAAVAPERQKTVPQQALHEERELRKAAEQRLQEAERQRATLEERTNLILQRLNQAQQQSQQDRQPGQEIPSFEQDPAGHLAARQQRLEQTQAEMARAVAAQARQNQIAAAQSQIEAQARAYEHEYAARVPDYDAAAEHLFDSRRRELEAAGWTNAAEVRRMMSDEANMLTAKALADRRNPAEIIYALAKVRGYTPAPPQADAQGGEQQLRTIEQGQQQTRSVGQLRGRGPEAISPQRVANMTPEEFGAFLDKATPDQMKNVFGS